MAARTANGAGESRIDHLRWTAYRVPFRTPYTTSRGTATHREGLLVEMTLADGRVGLGEAAADPESDLASAALGSGFLEVAPVLLLARRLDELQPRDFCDRDLHPAVASSLACALDTAACDLLAQQRGVSLAQLLDDGAVEQVPVNALITSPDLIAASRAATAAREAGYRSVKLKLGMDDDLSNEYARVAAVRRALGPGVRLRLDPNGKWDLATATRALRALAPLDIEYVEQPLPPGKIELLKRLQDMVDVPIAADEDVTDLQAALEIIVTRAAAVLVLKPQRLGGPRPCLQIIEEARRTGVRCVVTTNIDSGVGTAACLHLAAALPAGSPACGLATASLLEHDLTMAPIAVVDGAMRVPAGPGLGVRLDDDALARYTDGWHDVT